MKKTTLNQVKQLSNQLNNCHNTQELATLLGCSKNQITLLSFEPEYYHFTVPKKDNKVRLIEAPSQNLKHFQRKLNDYLQAFYYLHQTTASQGYIIRPLGNTTNKGVYNNALAHLGNTYMMNADFKDFFHQIKTQDVSSIFSSFFSFNKNTAHTLAKICTYKGRLPMGAPTSPALSNLYTIALDHELTKWSELHNAVYTRFVDDLCFSSKLTPFKQHHFNEIQEIALKHHLHFNPSKTKFLGKSTVKSVTGLLLKDTVDIDPEYYKELDKDILRLQHTVEVIYLTKDPLKQTFIKTYKQELMGKIGFIATIEGVNSPQYRNYINKYYQALEPPSDELVKRWTKFSNYS